jgi:hypothetical protein
MARENQDLNLLTNLKSSPPPNSPQWVSTSNLRNFYFDLSDDFLAGQIQNGSLQIGKHYLIPSSPNAGRRTILWNPKALIQLWGTDPAFRPICSARSKAKSQVFSEIQAV